MPDLHFRVAEAIPATDAVVPTLIFRVAISQSEQAVPIGSISLQCQLRIEARRRSYSPAEKHRLKDLFGASEMWSHSLQSMLWTHVHVNVPRFEQEYTVDLPVPCSFDFNSSSTKYFYGLDSGSVPVLLLFSGSVFYHDDSGTLAMDLIAQNKEAKHALPITVWQDMMDLYYPNSAWLCLDRDVFDLLYEYKRSQSYTDFDQALASLLTGRKAIT
jgi:hypothetical protein